METLLNLGLALALGLLVGVERGWQEREAAERSRLAGIRTFGLIGLLGGVWELARSRFRGRSSWVSLFWHLSFSCRWLTLPKRAPVTITA